MKLALLAFAVTGVLAGCQPQTKYEWGAYPNALLAYYREPTDRPAFDKALDDAIKTGEPKHRVPPGMYAEAGYEALSKGDSQNAIELFNREKAAWPESVAFMDKAIANASKAPAHAPESAPSKGAAQ
jgi:hypothetical protein